MNAVCKDTLFERLQTLSVVDTHEHFHTFSDLHGYDLIQFLYTNSYACTLAMYSDPDTVKLITNVDAPEQKRWEALCSLYARIRFTQCGRSMRDIVRLWGFEDLPPTSLSALDVAFNTRKPQAFMPKQICAYIVNSAGHPLYGYVRGLTNYLTGMLPKENGIYVNPLITGLHSISTKDGIDDIAAVAGTEIHSVAALVRAAGSIMKRCAEAGAVGFKDVYTYFRAFEIGTPDRSAAEKDFAGIQAGRHATGALADYLFYEIYDIAQQLHKPMAIHTGFIITTCEPASCLRTLYQVFRAFPGLAFDMYHLNFPLLEPYIQMIKSFSNLYANCAWVCGGEPEYTKLFLNEALRTLPAERVMVYGGDSHCAGEMTSITLGNTLGVIDSVLSEGINNKYLSAAEAEEVAGTWLSGSAKTLYGI